MPGKPYPFLSGCSRILKKALATQAVLRWVALAQPPRKRCLHYGRLLTIRAKMCGTLHNGRLRTFRTGRLGDADTDQVAERTRLEQAHLILHISSGGD